MRMMMARRVIIFEGRFESLILPCCLWFSPVPRHQPHLAQPGQVPALSCGGAERRTPVVVNLWYYTSPGAINVFHV